MIILSFLCYLVIRLVVIAILRSDVTPQQGAIYRALLWR